ncbi:hypothetical protein [Pseudomonas sp. Hp2]|uniref:hypothetical protein n=1 Tax=Pseudomonas sp. Hp2 TaxID=701189 RepID=UPI001125B691|nr:hypothetical protein [Pseudomonas sp. Hp2]
MAKYNEFIEHEKQLAFAQRYRKYEGAYNAAFAADPNPERRKFDELAPKDDIQWKRLKAYRGNDRDAYRAYMSDQDNPRNQPTETEWALWQANQKDHWRIEREPSFSAHPQSNNKWLPMSPEQRSTEKATKFFEQVEAEYGAGYDAYAAKAGSQAVAKDDYLRTMAVVDFEARAGRAQQQQQVRQQTPAEQAPRVNTGAQQEATPQQGAAQATQPKSRLSLTNFQGPTSEYVEQRGAEISKTSGTERAQIKQQAETKVGDVQAHLKDADSYVRLQNSLAQLREARALDSQSQAQSQSQTRNRSRSQ